MHYHTAFKKDVDAHLERLRKSLTIVGGRVWKEVERDTVTNVHDLFILVRTARNLGHRVELREVETAGTTQLHIDILPAVPKNLGS